MHALSPRLNTFVLDISLFFPTQKDLLTGWIKIRNAMKSWKTRWFVLRAGRLLYFKQEKYEAKKSAVGILELADCRVYARPTVKGMHHTRSCTHMRANMIYIHAHMHMCMPVGEVQSEEECCGHSGTS